jgi:hypothetical protein
MIIFVLKLDKGRENGRKDGERHGQVLIRLVKLVIK